MSKKHIGGQTVCFEKPPVIIGKYSVVGNKEGRGPYGMYFDEICTDPLVGGETWEEGESNLIKKSCYGAVKRAGIRQTELDFVVGGDLLGQLMATTFGVMQFRTPFFGIYGACSTMGESTALASSLVDGGFADICLAVTSSHFAGAEKQFRTPLNYGAWRNLTSSYTVTGSGAIVLASEDYLKQARGSEDRLYARVKGYTAGIITDYGIKDSNNMGACMAPAAYSTILAHFRDTGRSVDDYDLIVTGDLGRCGTEILIDLCRASGLDISKKHFDCGDHIFDEETQDTHAGGSGCGCCASMLCGYLIKCLEEEKYSRILFVPTGALCSPVSYKEGKTVPGIAHAIVLEAGRV